MLFIRLQRGCRYSLWPLSSALGDKPLLSRSFRIFTHDVPRQCPPDECWLLFSQSDYTTTSLCISDDCFLCPHVASDPIETSRNLPKFSSFEGALDFSWEVQHVSDIDWSSPGIVLSISSFVCQRNMEPWLVASVEGPSHLPSLPEYSEEGSVRSRVIDPRTGMSATWHIPTSGIRAVLATSAALLHHKFLAWLINNKQSIWIYCSWLQEWFIVNIRTFRSVSYGPCSRTGVTCVASDFAYSGWWIHEDNHLQEADAHGPVPQLQVTSPSNPQTFSCTHPHQQGTAVCHHSWRQEIWIGTRPQCPESQRIPRVGACTSTIQCKKTT